jgi:signal transduction histidine kinase
MKTLSSRLTLWYAFAATATVGVFILIGRFLIQESYLQGVDQLNDKEFEEIRPRIESYASVGNEEKAIEAIREHTELDASLFFFQVSHSGGRAFFTSSNLGSHELPSHYPEGKSTVVEDELGPLRVGVYSVGDFDIQIASSLQGLMTLQENLERIGLASLAAVFLTSAVIGLLLSRVALRPIERIERTAARISADRLSDRIEIQNTGDEIGKLALLLNSMFDRLERSFEEVKRFTADASHELKTPLSLIRLNAEEIRRRSQDKECQSMADGQMDIVDNLNKVVNDLLFLAKADGGALKVSVETHLVSGFLEEFSTDASALCEDKGLSFEYINAFSGKARFDPVWMRHVLFNLVSNAIRFSVEGGTIELRSFEKDGEWQVELRDEGPGIAPDRLDRVFERFYNEKDQHGRRGSGLGLPLCDSILRLHGGWIKIENRKQRSGALARFGLPLVKDV